MKLKLVTLTDEYRTALTDMMDEWTAAGEKIIPYAIRKADYRDFDAYKLAVNTPAKGDNLVPDTTFFCIDEENGRFVGAVNIRHYLNDELLLSGGHIGDGVRPSERGKGVGTEMIRLALDECRKLGITKVLMVCSKDNIASSRTIIKNGGVLENEIEVNGHRDSRYWIDLTAK